MFNEFELRLALEPRQVAVARRLPFIAEHGIGRWRHEDVVSDYFDTDDLALWRAGYSLRVRESRGVLRQTLKAELAGDNDWSERGEWEVNIPGPVAVPDFRAMAEWDMPGEVAEILGDAKLVRCFRASFSRSRRMIEVAGSTFEVAIDKGRIVARNGAEADFACLEVEYKSGSRHQTVIAAATMAEALGARLEPLAKSARGFALLLGRYSPHHAVTASIKDATTPAEAYARVAAQCLAHFEANEACAFEGRDIEGIHQARVALRRWRSALGLFRDALTDADRALAQEIRWLASACGPARDWDVFISEVLTPMIEAMPEDRTLRKLLEAAEVRRKDAYGIARASLHSRRSTSLRLAAAARIHEILEAPKALDAASLKDFADMALHKRRRKLRKLGRRVGELEVTDLHRMRILAKKARYACDFLGGIYERKAVRRHARRLAGLQEAMGGLNDAVVGQTLLDEIRQKEAGRRGSHAWLDHAETAVRGWLAAISRERLSHLVRAWEDYNELKAFWDKPEEKRRLEAA